jgi:hypothetical protein
LTCLVRESFLQKSSNGFAHELSGSDASFAARLDQMLLEQVSIAIDQHQDEGVTFLSFR